MTILNARLSSSYSREEMGKAPTGQQPSGAMVQFWRLLCWRFACFAAGCWRARQPATSIEELNDGSA
jgi:hypothetical protein